MDLHCSMALSSSLKLTSSEAAAISSCRGVSGDCSKNSTAGTTYQSSLVILEIFEPLVDGFSCGLMHIMRLRVTIDDVKLVPSGVWNMPALPSNSLVGRPEPEIAPGRGEAGERPWPMPEGGRAEPGPMEARKLGDLPLALPAGPGEGLGLGGACSEDMIWDVCCV